MRILIVDPDTAFALITKEKIGKNYQVEEVNNAFDALVKLNNGYSPDLILLEINLPGFDGFKFIEKLNGNLTHKSIPIIVFSTFNRDNDQNKAIELGAYAFINKKDRFENVLSEIESVKTKIENANNIKGQNATLSGNLSDLLPPDILQIINLSHNSGQLELQNDNQVGSIVISKGKLIYAETSSYYGEAALFYLFSWKTGTFNFKKIDVSKIEPNMSLLLNYALLKGTKFVDEIEDTCKLVPVLKDNLKFEIENENEMFLTRIIDGQSSINKLAENYNLNKYLAAHYYLSLENETKCKLVIKNKTNVRISQQNKNKKIKVLLVDDSRIILKGLEKVLLEESESFEIEKATNGKKALEKACIFRPDVITLDVNMPVMDGLTALKYIMVSNPIPVVMLSSLTSEGSETAFDALRFGAVDFITKPVNNDVDTFNAQKEKIKKTIRHAAKVNIHGVKRVQIKNWQRRHETNLPSSVNNLVIIGASYGSYNAIMQLLTGMQGDINTPVVIHQYIEPKFLGLFVDYLNRFCEIKNHIAKDVQTLKNGHCYFVPHTSYGTYQLEKSISKLMLSKMPFDEDHEHSINIAMFSASETFSQNCTGVLLSGSSKDGAEGLLEIKRQNGYSIIQDPSTCIQTTSVLEALRNKSVTETLFLNQISQKVYRTVVDVR